LFASLERSRGDDLEEKKSNEQVKEIEENGRKEFWGVNFLHNIKLILWSN